MAAERSPGIDGEAREWLRLRTARSLPISHARTVRERPEDAPANTSLRCALEESHLLEGFFKPGSSLDTQKWCRIIIFWLVLFS